MGNMASFATSKHPESHAAWPEMESLHTSDTSINLPRATFVNLRDQELEERQEREQSCPPSSRAEKIVWSASKNPIKEMKGCFKKRIDFAIHFGEDWKEELPKLCTLLGLKYRASTAYVLATLRSSNAFSMELLNAAGFVPSSEEEAQEVVWEAGKMETGSVRLKVRIPIIYEAALKRRKDLELFVKNEIARALGVSETILNPEIHIEEIRRGSVVVHVILGAAALTLCVAVLGFIPQRPTWQDRRFQMLLAMGCAAVGSALGVAAGGDSPRIKVGIGAVSGVACALTLAWLLDREVRDAAARSEAFLLIRATIIRVIIKQNRIK